MKCLVFVLMAAAASAQPYELGLTLQSGGERKVYRGWPLIVRGTALWTHDAEDREEGGPEGVKLNAGAASLAIYNAGGAEVELPLRPAAPAEAAFPGLRSWRQGWIPEELGFCFGTGSANSGLGPTK